MYLKNWNAEEGSLKFILKRYIISWEEIVLPFGYKVKA